MRVVLAVLLSLAAVGAARADCDHFKWSVAQERAWFAGSPSPLPAEGGSAAAGQGYALALSKDAKLPTPPERAPKPDTNAAVVGAPQLAAGLYQVTLSAEAWIDVVQNGARLKSMGFSGQRDCPNVRKSVRFELAAGPATVEISNAASDKMLFAISAAK
jgi:hypothetical protein